MSSDWESIPLDTTGPQGEFINRSQRLPLHLPTKGAGVDCRLYLPQHPGWEAAIKHDWSREYCYAKAPGEDWFHPLAAGEIYIQRGDEKFCLMCALRLKILTRNRVWWQKGSEEPRDQTAGDQVAEEGGIEVMGETPPPATPSA